MNTNDNAPPIHLPEPPQGASYDHLMDFASVCGIVAISHPVARRVALAYLKRWHPTEYVEVVRATPPQPEGERERHWRTADGRRCVNCGQGLMQHAGQVHCPADERAEGERERIADVLMEVATDDAYYRTQSPRGAALFAADRILAALRAHPSPERAEGEREVTPFDAPGWMDADAASAWADGYNEALAALRAQPDAVRIPTSEDEAALMVLLGTEYLTANAPHRLRTQPDADADAVRALEGIVPFARHKARCAGAGRCTCGYSDALDSFGAALARLRGEEG